MKKTLINIRGAGASGKTTAVKQFCERRGFSVERVETPFSILPISVIDGGKITVFGDYSANGKCLGADRYKNGKRDIQDAMIECARIYNSDFIIYEHMMTSHTFKGTKEIAEVARAFGYEYLGIQIFVSEEERLRRLRERSGENAGTKNFNANNLQRVERTSKMLNEAGIRVVPFNVENIDKCDMWKVVEYGIRQAME